MSECECLSEALRLLRAGQSVIPLGVGKTPAVSRWKQYSERLPTEAEVRRWFASPHGIGRICGAVSGNIEVIDFDVEPIMEVGSLDDVYGAWRDTVEGYAPGLVDKLKIVKTPRPGLHVSYRCESVPAGNQKLAMVWAPDSTGEHQWRAFVETRGEGGYVAVPCTPAWCHGKDGTYAHEAGPLVEQVITNREREILLQAARMMTLKTEEALPTPQQAAQRSAGAVLPGDDFNERGNWDEVFPVGWTRVAVVGEEERWLRPGGSSRWSAVCNHGGSNMVVAFSTATGLENDRGYSKFSAFCVLQCNNDPQEASRRLREMGYGTDSHGAGMLVDVSELIASEGMPQRREPEPVDLEIDPEILRLPGLGGMLQDFHEATAHRPSMTFATVFALCVLSLLTARIVATQSMLLTNLLILVLGPSGSGKDHPRKLLRQLANEAGFQDRIGPDGVFTSSGMNACLAGYPIQIFLVDEFGKFLADHRTKNSEDFTRNLLTLHTSASEVFVPSGYAKAERNQTLCWPHLLVAGTSVQEAVWQSSASSLHDGTFARMLAFDVKQPAKKQRTRFCNFPSEIVELCKAWLSFCAGGCNLGNLHFSDKPATPVLLEFTDEAWGRLEEFDDRWETLACRTLERDGKSVWTRLAEQASKLALIHRCSRMAAEAISAMQTEPTSIELVDIEWGCVLAETLAERLLINAGRNIARNAREDMVNRIRELIRSASSGLSKSEITNKTTNLGKRDRDEILLDLIEVGDIVRATIRTAGRPREVYVSSTGIQS